jgi:micrococcal nuclease
MEKKLSISPDGTYIYKAEVVKIVDGDTVDLLVDLGFGIKFKQRFRLYGINAPEMRGETKEAGKISKVYLQELIEEQTLFIQTFKDKQGKYGRYLATLFLGDICINDIMVKNGYAVEFMRRKG